MANAKALKYHNDQLDQGDVLANVPFLRWKAGKGDAAGTPARGLVTANGCTCEDYDRAIASGKSSAAARVMIQVAPLRSATVFSKEQQEEIKLGQRLDLFYVYGEGSRLDDQVAVLTHEQPIPAEVLVDCPKVARIADWQWSALLVHIAVSRFHVEPKRLFLPELLKEAAGEA